MPREKPASIVNRLLGLPRSIASLPAAWAATRRGRRRSERDERKRRLQIADRTTWLTEHRVGGLPAPLVAESWYDLDRAYDFAAEGLPPPDALDLLGFEVHFVGLDPLRCLFHEIAMDDTYLFRSGTPAPRILDCGANIGFTALYFKLLHPQARITCFEPGAEAFGALEANIAANQLEDVTALPLALAGTAGERALYVSEEEPGSLRMSLLPNRLPEGRPRIVKAVALSDFVRGPIDLLKLDIEGSEYEVLEELAAADKLRHIREAFIEVHHHLEANEDHVSRLLALLEDQGFGYLLRSTLAPGTPSGEFQDVFVHAYRK